MKKIKFIILLLSLSNLIFSNARAADSVGDCLGIDSKSELANPDVPLSGLVVDGKSKFLFCYQLSKDPGKKAMNEDFKMLDVMGVFDSNGCVKDEKRDDNTEAMLQKFISKVVNENVKIYATVNPETKQANLIYSNSPDKGYIDNSLKTKDKWQIAGFAVGSIVVGTLLSRELYKGQEDKRKHEKGGAIISIGTTAVSYFLLETLGVGDKLGLTQAQKKYLIMLSGPIMGTIAGVYKEYKDTKDRAHHTPDVNDASATSLGAGGAIFSVAFAF